MEKYLEFIIIVTESKEEEVVYLLDDLGFEGVESIVPLSVEKIKSLNGDYSSLIPDEPSDMIEIKAYIKNVVYLGNKSMIDELIDYEKINEINDDSYLLKYKEYFHTHSIGNRFVVVPPWEEYSKGPDEIVISIDPGLAFGTGKHETTKNVILMMESLDFKEKSVADVGAGSGILGIAAIKLGASQVVATDICESSVKEIRENAFRNGIEKNIIIKRNDLLMGIDNQFDIVIGNLVAELDVRLIKELENKLNKNAIIIISGIIINKLDFVLKGIEENNYQVDEMIVENNWVTISIFKKY